MSAPVVVVNQKQMREKGAIARMNNIKASTNVAEIIRSTLGPQSMLKMVLDPMGGLVLTNDGNAILREIDVSHPASKAVVELARSQDEQVGDGTTSAVVFAGEVMGLAAPLLDRNIHPITITHGYYQALEDAVKAAKTLSRPLDINNEEEMLSVIRASLGTKYVSRWSDLMTKLALKAVSVIGHHLRGEGEGESAIQTSTDMRARARIEKIPGGTVEECEVLSGVMINKDVLHPEMPQKIENPRVVCLDFSFKYEKANSQLNVEMNEVADYESLLTLEEDYLRAQVAHVMRVKPDVVVTEKACVPFAQHLFVKEGVAVLRRVRKSGNNRVALVTGATVLHRPEDIEEHHVGTGAGLFEVRKIGDETFSFIHHAENPRACTVLLRGAAKDVLNEIERNLLDAMSVARNVLAAPAVVPGGGAFEMALAAKLEVTGRKLEGQEQTAYLAIAKALEVIPRTLLQNCGANVIRRITELRALHHKEGNDAMGVNGVTGQLCDTWEAGIWDPLSTKVQIVKSAIDSACMILRCDDLIKARAKKDM
ncbi:T-complex protein 1, gamma subunit [Kipferlia bialata]|uniref:T-complex protein 1 subunit gamma n=1 Tax=Kipferlia bialata TaxID=797122 RepID=A0A9K3CVY9_9EUKA|nr:T-complex protein 1, gamma subunit [Kipferlia bialata]|eukprot:g5785.t1